MVLNIIIFIIIITISQIYSKENKSKLECNYVNGTTHEVGKKLCFAEVDRVETCDEW